LLNPPQPQSQRKFVDSSLSPLLLICSFPYSAPAA
jgi:hypothetical protein